jgi:peptidoglycan/xylan/chitin deacetylase (PgdA/CDA1 family)
LAALRGFTRHRDRDRLGDLGLSETVLCYHAVSPTWEHRLSIHPDLLERQVRLLARFRPLRVSFDDAFRSAASVFLALERLGVPIQIFVCTDYAREGAPLAIPELAGDDPRELATMTWDELRAHVERGVFFGSHGVSHAHLTELGDDEVRRELVDSKRELEDELARACSDFAYPYGEHDARVRALVRQAGYERAYGLNADRRDPYALRRLDLYRRHSPVTALLRLATW